VAPVPPTLVLELVAAVLDAGAPPEQAIEAVAWALERAGDPQAADLRAARDGSASGDGAASTGGTAAGDGVVARALREMLALSAATGLPLAALVRGAARDVRRARSAAQAAATHRLAVLVVLPTGLCLLPAFVLLGVVPLILDLLTGL